MLRSKIFTLTILIFIAFSTACKKDDPSPSTPNTGTGTGSVTFWNDQTAVGDITVVIDGISRTITHNISPSDCNTTGCANFTLTAGTHSYSASSTTGETWGPQNFTISKNGCLKYNLYK